MRVNGYEWAAASSNSKGVHKQISEKRNTGKGKPRSKIRGKNWQQRKGKKREQKREKKLKGKRQELRRLKRQREKQEEKKEGGTSLGPRPLLVMYRSQGLPLLQLSLVMLTGPAFFSAAAYRGLLW